MLKEICKQNTCTACNACVNICPKQCITMKEDALDALQPSIDNNKCIECGLCIKTCPNNRTLKWHTDKSVFAAWSTDQCIRHTSASGGVATELYNYYLNNKGFCVGVSFNDNHEAVFIPISKPEDLHKVQNSKYVYSNTLDIYKQIKVKLIEGLPTLFIGLPCQVSGLQSFLGKEYNNLTTIDIVCHGVVPTEYLQQHISKIEKKKHTKAKEIFFRNPDFQTYTFTFTLKDAKNIFYKKQVYEDDVYQLGYHKALIYRENCYSCQYAQQKRLGDLTICDFSGVGLKAPFEFERNNVSCILVNTDKGAEILQKLKGKLTLVERPREEAFEYEPQLNHPYKRHERRTFFINRYGQTKDFCNSASIALKLELQDYRNKHSITLTQIINAIKRKMPQSLKKRIRAILRCPYINQSL